MFTSPYVLTKLDIVALRKMDTLLVAFQPNRDEKTLVHCIKRADKSADPFAQEARHVIPAKVTCLGDFPTRDVSRAQCWAHVSVYPSQHCHASSLLATLRAGDAIAFDFQPDYHSNGYVARAGLHADVLLMYVYRGDETMRKLHAVVELDHGIAPDGNSARMVRGVASSDWYHKSAADVG